VLFRSIALHGEPYGYVLISPAKCVLVVPAKWVSEARHLFPEIPPENIRPAAKYLGGFIGEPAAVRQLLDAKVEDLCQQLHFYQIWRDPSRNLHFLWFNIRLCRR